MQHVVPNNVWPGLNQYLADPKAYRLEISAPGLRFVVINMRTVQTWANIFSASVKFVQYKDGIRRIMRLDELYSILCVIVDALNWIVPPDALCVLCPSLYWTNLTGTEKNVCPSSSQTDYAS